MLLQSYCYNLRYCSLIPRPLKMDEGLSTSKRQAEGEIWTKKLKYITVR